MMQKPANTDAYIASFPKETQRLLKQVREAIKQAAPKAEEMISYGMPAYKLNGRPLVYFAGYEHHIGFYPTPVAIESFKKELSVYKNAKGSVQFPIDKAMPVSLIKQMVKFKVAQNAEKEKTKKNKYT